MKCPCCLTELSGLARYCADCGDYIEDLASTTDATPEARERTTDDRSEAEIRLVIRTALEAHGFVVLDFEQGYRADGSTRVRRGLPDLAIMAPGGVFAWRELKSAKGRLTKEQRAFGEECRRLGIDWAVWRHEDEAIAWAERLKEAAA